MRVLQLRSKIALGQAKDVSTELASEKTPDLIAVKLLADQEQGKDVLSQAKKLAEQYGQENLNVQLLVGIVLEKAGETEEALALLSKHQGSLDAYVQLLLCWLAQVIQSIGVLTPPTASPSSSRSTFNKTEQILPPRKPSAPANGPKTACLSTLPNHGSACEKYALHNIIITTGTTINTFTGRREIPIRILRLRRACPNVPIPITALARCTGRI